MQRLTILLIFCVCALTTLTPVRCLPSPVTIDDWAPVTDRKDLLPSSSSSPLPITSSPNTQIKQPETIETTSQKNLQEEGRRRNGFGNRRRGDKKNSYSDLIVPTFIFPAVVFASFLPFLIPVLKLAALFAGAINNAALVAGILYLARQNALEQEQRQVFSFNPGYLRRRTAIIG